MSGVSVSSHVPHPHIKSCIGQDEGQTFIWQICDPIGGSTKESVLQEDNWLFTLPLGFIATMWDAIDAKEIPVISLDNMFFSWIAPPSYKKLYM
jgi:hypothetical protein